jgi:hypothetical protein
MISNTIGSRADKSHETDIKQSEHVCFVYQTAVGNVDKP